MSAFLLFHALCSRVCSTNTLGLISFSGSIEKFVVDWSSGVIVAGSTAQEVLDKFEVYTPPKSRFDLKWPDFETKQDFV
jgi:hypothetical protein